MKIGDYVISRPFFDKPNAPEIRGKITQIEVMPDQRVMYFVECDGDGRWCRELRYDKEGALKQYFK